VTNSPDDAKAALSVKRFNGGNAYNRNSIQILYITVKAALISGTAAGQHAKAKEHAWRDII